MCVVCASHKMVPHYDAALTDEDVHKTFALTSNTTDPAHIFDIYDDRLDVGTHTDYLTNLVDSGVQYAYASSDSYE